MKTPIKPDSLTVTRHDCNDPLTPTELYCYGHRCEKCEDAWAERLHAWMRGGEDDELEEMFGGCKS